MLDTRTSPGPASAATRAPMWTAIPRDLVAGSSISPVWRPARILEPERPDRRAIAQGTADGARGAVESRQEAVAGRVDLAAAEALRARARTSAWCASSRSPPAPVAELAARSRRAHDVGEQHRRQHPVGLRTGRTPVRNSSISSRIASLSPTHGRWSRPGSSTSFAPGMRSAMYRPRSTVDRPVAGAVEDQRGHTDRRQDGRTSISAFIRTVRARARDWRPSAGSAPNSPKALVVDRLGALMSSPTVPPQSRAISSMKARSALTA